MAQEVAPLGPELVTRLEDETRIGKADAQK